ncbi:VWA domain-containing protein [Nocardioides mangrovicus]|uniref:VWA domain-containing protein n=1 Tax=Nocardioides mangrovicus TaxID=2478913 RepID=A0A3L8NWM3_9ACTN|nr:VWA domain-containing protein [Nocardioides mangrovicus]RLV47555.1 VWA domain-containing protein [Nocardioides mangrovicus]
MRDVEEVLLGFTRALRAAGVNVTTDREMGYLEAVALVGLDDVGATYTAGRATLCSGPDDLDRYDQVFHAWFGDRAELPRSVPRESPREIAAPLPVSDDPEETGGEGSPDVLNAAASEAEVLRHRDVASLDGRQKALLDAMIASLRPRPPRRRAIRRTPWRRGEVDLHRTLRASLQQLGEPAVVAHRRRATQPRRLVLLVDVSASMRPYADALLRLCHRLVQTGAPVEVFTLGTRLTRITAALRAHDPERALVRAGDEVPDWSGGTRLGETLAAFLDRWGARGMARGAVVVVLSDGWERGDARQLGEQMQRLQRLARRVVWVNPHRGKAGYEPLQSGIVAALPHCDDFIAGHSLRSFEAVLEVVGGA